MEILYEDKDIIVCVKPVGVLSQSSEKDENNMVDLLSKGGERAYIGVIHRLDREVGGVMVYAKNPTAAAVLSESVRERKMRKEYLAVLEGIPEEREAVLEDLLFKDSRKNKSYVVKRMRRGVKKASLSYKLLGSTELDGNAVSLVKVHLHTGRSHQIRVQFSSRGLPLYGDRRYGGKMGSSIALWSYSLGFKHPAAKGEEMIWKAAAPSNMPWILFPFCAE